MYGIQSAGDESLAKDGIQATGIKQILCHCSLVFLRASQRLTAFQRLTSGQHPTPVQRAARLLTVRNGELAKFERQTGKTLRESGQVGHDHPLKTFKDVPRREAKEPIVNKSGPGDQGPSVLQCYHRKALVGLELLCPYPVQTFQT